MVAPANEPQDAPTWFRPVSGDLRPATLALAGQRLGRRALDSTCME